ncbi:MAG: alginate export family protein, partial [Planctomycetota bacterium]
MEHRLNVLVSVFVVMLFCGVGICGQEDLPGPKYSNLRYDEDFSYLGGPEDSYKKDFLDPIKWIELGDDWFLTIGGQSRLRFEVENDKNFGSSSPMPTHDSFLLQRYFVHGDLKHDEWLRFFVEGKFVYVAERDSGNKSSLEDRGDIHQVFADVSAGIQEEPVTFRIGRQELQYGAQRLISPLDWGNLRRRFEGAKAFTNVGDWRIDAFAVFPVKNDRSNLDDRDQKVEFYGLYSTGKFEKKLKTDLYLLTLKNNNKVANSNGNVGRSVIYTPGTRVWGNFDNMDYEVELAGQFGRFSSDHVFAWMATAGGGYTFDDCDWKPRVGLLYDYASGDDDPADSTHGTFNQHYPLGHAYLGYMDLVGRQNIHALKAQVKVKPCKKVV